MPQIWRWRVVRVTIGLALSLGPPLTPGVSRLHAEEVLLNPFLGQPEAIDEGKQTYRAKCVICHGKAGGRGPNLFATKLGDEQFLETVINGRKGTLMPVFGLRLSPDDVWKVHAFVKATPNGL